MNFFQRWLRRRTDDANEAAWVRGFDYAAGKLLRKSDPEELLLESDAFSQATKFDEGMVDAVNAWNARIGQ